MAAGINRVIRKVRRKALGRVMPEGPGGEFRTNEYLRMTFRRLEHLASLRIPARGKSVFEVGAGIGDHSQYYLDRDCQILITEAREELLEYMRLRFPGQEILRLDMESDWSVDGRKFDIVHCYGLLYHLGNPAEALRKLAASCQGMMFLETCVSFGSQPVPNVVNEETTNPTQAVSGRGCRPTRIWLFQTLKSLFPHVYIPVTQPNHEQFPLDWTAPDEHPHKLSRAIFIASRQPILNDQITDRLIEQHTRHP